MTPLAQLIQTHRKKAGLTQTGLASLAGVGKTVVWDIEHGKESIQWDTLQKVLRVLNITIQWRSPLLERMALASASASSFSSRSSPLPSTSSAGSKLPTESPPAR